jgi:hypothetical protein
LGLPTVEASAAGNFRLNLGGRGFPAAGLPRYRQLLRRPVLNRIICNLSELQETCSERSSHGLQIMVRSFAEAFLVCEITAITDRSSDFADSVLASRTL